MKHKFIGCATDARFVEPTAVMLTSLDLNGNVPEAGIIVAAFELSERDRNVIRCGAGRMGGNLRFLDIGPDLFGDVAYDNFTTEYPPSVLGRLFIAEQIDLLSARLLTLDSDMIVNNSVRQLFDLDLESQFFAAIHDPPRQDDLNYFNSGLMLFDVDKYRYYNIAHRAMRYIAEHRPHFPDQDALNAVIGDEWYRLHRLWNYFYAGGRSFSLEDYEVARVAHFCGAKPWDHPDHPALPLYQRYLRILRSRVADSDTDGRVLSGEFIANCYEIFLGRQPESEGVIAQCMGSTRTEIIRNFLTSNEFIVEIFPGLVHGPRQQITFRQRMWVSNELPITHQTRQLVRDIDDKYVLLKTILSDVLLQATCRLPRYGYE